MPKSTARQTPVAIIGMGCIFAKSPDLKAFLQLIISGRDGISDPPPSHEHLRHYYDPDPKRPDHIYCNRGGFLPCSEFDPSEFGIPPNALEATDTSQLLGLMTAKKALEDAGYGADGKPFDRTRASVILGVTGTQELVIPLGARLGHPIWRQAMDQAGIESDKADAIIEQVADSYVSVAGKFLSGFAGQCGGRTYCQSLGPWGYQLRG